MKAGDVITTDAVSLGPDTSTRDICQAPWRWLKQRGPGPQELRQRLVLDYETVDRQHCAPLRHASHDAPLTD